MSTSPTLIPPEQQPGSKVARRLEGTDPAMHICQEEEILTMTSMKDIIAVLECEQGGVSAGGVARELQRCRPSSLDASALSARRRRPERASW